MKLKNIILIFVSVVLFTLISTSCSITVSKNYYGEQQKESDSTASAIKLDSHLSKPNDGQK